MNILILGGASPRHKEWVRLLADYLKPRASAVAYLDYRHWEVGGETDLDYEVEQATRLAETMQGDYAIIAKSIGTVIAATAIGRGQLKPARCIFLGFPLKIVDEFPDIATHLAALPATTIMQNEHDPLGSFADVARYITNNGNAQVAVVACPGDTHDYADFAAVASLLT